MALLHVYAYVGESFGYINIGLHTNKRWKIQEIFGNVIVVKAALSVNCGDVSFNIK
jgi:hypothetical protein